MEPPSCPAPAPSTAPLGHVREPKITPINFPGTPRGRVGSTPGRPFSRSEAKGRAEERRERRCQPNCLQRQPRPCPPCKKNLQRHPSGRSRRTSGDGVEDRGEVTCGAQGGGRVSPGGVPHLPSPSRSPQPRLSHVGCTHPAGKATATPAPRVAPGTCKAPEASRITHSQ